MPKHPRPDPSSPPARLRLRPGRLGDYIALVFLHNHPNWSIAAAGLTEGEAVCRALELCGRRGIEVDVSPLKRLLEGQR